MTLGSTLAWIVAALVLMVIGARGGLLLILSRGIDYARAALCCAEICWRSARREWAASWQESLRWARLSR